MARVGTMGHETRGRIGVDTRRRGSAAQAVGGVRGGVADPGRLHVALSASGARDDRGLLDDVVDLRRHLVWPLCAERTVTGHS